MTRRVLVLFLLLPVAVAIARGSVGLAQESSPPSERQTVVLSDDFENPSTGWLPGESRSPSVTTVAYIDGEYQIERTATESNLLGKVFLPGRYDDTSLAIDARLVGDTGTRIIQLGCRTQPGPDSEYRMVLTPDRRTVAIRRRIGGTAVTLAERPSGAILQGNETNHLEMRCVGSTISALVNGVEIASAHDTTFREGQLWIGVFAPALQAEARFDNLVLSQVSVPAPPPVAAAPPAADADLATRLAPSVVQVLVPFAAGSGVKIPQGVLTNAHVVSGAARIEVVTGDGRRSAATVVSLDSTRDLALLSTDLDLPSTDLAPARSLRQGDTLFVLGYPRADLLGGQSSLTRGIVSAIREIDQRLLVQTDAAINAGNSGGPVVNAEGKVVAIATSRVRGAEGLNMGVATETVQQFLSGPSTRPLPGPTVIPQGSHMLADNFDDPAIGVLPRSSDDPSRYRRGYASNEYQIQTLDPTMRGAGAIVPGIYGDAAISLDARLLPTSSEDASVAAGCRGQVGAAPSGYLLSIKPADQQFLLVRLGEGRASLAAGVSEAIRPPSEPNHVELSCAGTTIAATINGVPVASVEDSGYASGSMLILLGTSSGTADVRFDNLVVTGR